MRQDWWHVYVNDELLVSVNGFDSAMWAFNYLKKDTSNTYVISQVKRENIRTKDSEPVKLQDIIDNANNK